MRMLLRVALPTETANAAVKAGTLGSTINQILAGLKAEAVYFFLDDNGLNIVEPDSQSARDASQAARVVNLASWGDADRTKLVPHEPEPTDMLVELAVH